MKKLDKILMVIMTISYMVMVLLLQFSLPEIDYQNKEKVVVGFGLMYISVIIMRSSMEKELK